MHSSKKIALKEELERLLPSAHVDCIVTGGWIATIIIASPGEDGEFCASGVDLSRLNMDEIAPLAVSLVQEREMFMIRSP